MSVWAEVAQSVFACVYQSITAGTEIFKLPYSRYIKLHRNAVAGPRGATSTMLLLRMTFIVVVCLIYKSASYNLSLSHVYYVRTNL